MYPNTEVFPDSSVHILYPDKIILELKFLDFIYISSSLLCPFSS